MVLSKKGRNIYAPKVLISEMENIKKSEELFSDSEALKKMAGYSVLGRQVKIKGELPIKKRKKGDVTDLFGGL